MMGRVPLGDGARLAHCGLQQDGGPSSEEPLLTAPSAYAGGPTATLELTPDDPQFLMMASSTSRSRVILQLGWLEEL